MLRGLYEAGWSLQAATLNQELAAENLANAATTGYRRQGLSFGPVLDAAANAPVNEPSQAPRPYTSFAPGRVAADRKPFRPGHQRRRILRPRRLGRPGVHAQRRLRAERQGDLQNRAGLRVQGQGGRINVPLDATRIEVTADGVVMADGAEVGRLRLARFANPQALQRVGPTLFEGPGASEPETGTVRVEQGYREGANVEMIHEMISMMIGLRQYEAAERHAALDRRHDGAHDTAAGVNAAQ